MNRLESPAGLRLDQSPLLLGRRGSAACNCRTVDLNLRNDVSNAKVRTGDATDVNFNVTYVSAGYGDREVEVDQEAEAISGDAIAGQLIGVDARGPRCVNVRVNATNRVKDSTVESGAATAINHSVVLLDPTVRRGDLDIDVEQEAEAHSGNAIAGQVIGVMSAGGGRCRGRVDLKALNEVLNTKVRTGKASFFNESEIRICAAPGCAAELRKLIGQGARLESCTHSRCRRVRADDLDALLASEEPLVDPDDETQGEEDERINADTECETGSTPSPPPSASPAPAADAAQPTAQPQPTPAPDQAGPSSSPQATSSAPPCPTPEPSPASGPELIASGDEPKVEPGT
jgi:hypothetical protein